MQRSRFTIAGFAMVMLIAVADTASSYDLVAIDGGVEAAADAPGAVARGKYILYAAGCITCHTAEHDEAIPLAGGRALKTDFGTFHSPNITPDSETGIGDWRAEDLHRALRHGIAPDGSPYYPVFPYTSYAAMSDADITDLFAYLNALAPVNNRVAEHELQFPYSIRLSLWPWRWMYFDTDAPFLPQRDGDPVYNRGAYLVNALGHCAECHTPRNRLGALDRSRHLAGNPNGPEGRRIPNVTPHEDGLKGWSRRDITFLLQTGFYPDGDVVGSGMGAVVRDNTSRLSASDRNAIADYLRAIEALPAAQ